MNYKTYQNGKEVSGALPFGLMQTEAIGVFESMRAYDGRILHEEDHLARLLESAKTVGYKPVPKLQKLRSELDQSLRAFQRDSPSKSLKGTVPFKNLYVRLMLWEGLAFAIVGQREHSNEIYEKGVALKTASFPRGGPSTFPWQAKASAYQQAVLASTEPRPEKSYEWLFLDSQGLLSESRVGNFFIVKYPEKGDPMLFTPPEHLILNGVTRRFVIKCALELKFRVREVPLTRHEFFNADEAFLSNTSWEILPVRELDGRVIGAGKPGPVTLKLHHFFQRRVQQDVTKHRSPRAY
jgi:branched-chain amino acid aminotransferase